MRPKIAEAVPYLFAVVATAVAVTGRWLLDPYLGQDLSLITLFPAVAASVWFGGYRPALLATLLGYAVCNALFIAPRGQFGLYDTRDVVGCIMYLLSSGLLIGFGEALRTARRRADVVLNEAQRMAHAGSWEWTAANDRLVASDGVRRIFAIPPDMPVPGFHQQDGILFPHDSWLKLDAVIREALRTGRGYELDLEAFRAGDPIWVTTRSEVVSDGSGKIAGLRGTFQDITDRKRAEALQEAQKRILEQIARRVELPEVLTEVARSVEQQEPGLLCSIHVLDGTGTYLHAGAGPSLPAAYMQAMESVPISAGNEGPCSQVVQTCGDVLVRDIAADTRYSKRWRNLALESGLRSVRSTIVRAGNGVPLATFAMYRRQTGDPEPSNLQLGFAARQLVAIAVERHLDDAELRRAEADARLLQTLGTELVGEAGERTVYQKIIDGAAVLMRSQFASLQTIETLPEGDAELRLLAFRGFSAFAARYWDRVRLMSPTTCAEALRTRSRAMVPDVAACSFLQGTDDLATFRETGIVAMQTTPLISRTGKMVGMISTHWSRPYVPPERDLRNLDILARQAADLLERKRNQEALREADRRKDEFLATLAHELRNPLAPIRNSLTMMRLSASTEPEQLREMLERQVQHLIRLVDDLLDVSRITRGTMTLRREPVELEGVVQHAVETTRPLAKALGHDVTVELPKEAVWLNADPVRLAQVFNNLLNNACKYTEPKGHVSLTAERQGNEVVVRVRDSGLGIPPERLTNIFEMFTQVDRSLERSQGGLGIGLTLVKRLVDLHGGSVIAHSEGRGRGSEFVVRLPVLQIQVTSDVERPLMAVGGPKPVREIRAAPAPALASPSAAAPTGVGASGGPAPSRRVLVVDDNTDSADSMALLLKVSGSVTRTAKDGLEALEAAKEFQPDIVFLDIGMPKLNGYDAARRIRQEPWGRDMVLVAMTGWGQEEDRRRSRAAGFDAHIVKPADYTEVVRLMGSTRRARRPAVD